MQSKESARGKEKQSKVAQAGTEIPGLGAPYEQITGGSSARELPRHPPQGTVLTQFISVWMGSEVFKHKTAL